MEKENNKQNDEDPNIIQYNVSSASNEQTIKWCAMILILNTLNSYTLSYDMHIF